MNFKRAAASAAFISIGWSWALAGFSGAQGHRWASSSSSSHNNGIAAHTDPPTLQGQLFHYVGSPNRYRIPAFYELHVWAARDNPNGTFADWNPKVSCDDLRP